MLLELQHNYSHFLIVFLLEMFKDFPLDIVFDFEPEILHHFSIFEQAHDDSLLLLQKNKFNGPIKTYSISYFHLFSCCKLLAGIKMKFDDISNSFVAEFYC